MYLLLLALLHTLAINWITQLTLIDVRINQTIKIIKVPDAPAGIASGHNNKVYVTTPENGSFVIINSQTIIKTIDVGGVAGYSD